MGEAKRRGIKPTDGFLAKLFSPEVQLDVTPYFVVVHEVGHAIAGTFLEHPIEFTSVRWTLDNMVGGFTKNTERAKVVAEADMRANNRDRALQLAAIQFAGPLAEYRACVTRCEGTEAISYSSRTDKLEAFRTFAYANNVYGEIRIVPETGDVDFSVLVRLGLDEPAWAKWKDDAYALAKSTLDTPGARIAAEKISAEMIRSLQRGCEVRRSGAEIQAALNAAAPT